MSEKAEVLLSEGGSDGAEPPDPGALEAGENSLLDSEDLRGLIAQGRERGYLTFEEISATLEEVEVTKEQVSALHAHLVEHGVEVIAEDGVSAYEEAREAARGIARRHGRHGRRVRRRPAAPARPRAAEGA